METSSKKNLQRNVVKTFYLSIWSTFFNKPRLILLDQIDAFWNKNNKNNENNALYGYILLNMQYLYTFLFAYIPSSIFILKHFKLKIEKMEYLLHILIQQQQQYYYKYLY